MTTKRKNHTKTPTRRKKQAPKPTIQSLHRYRSYLVREASPVEFSAEIHTTRQAVKWLSQFSDAWDREHIYVVHIGTDNAVLGIELAAIGTDHLVHVSPSEILRGAILAGARGIVVVHNHTNGVKGVSNEDIAVAHTIRTACDAVGVELLDAVAVNSDGEITSALNGHRTSTTRPTRNDTRGLRMPVVGEIRNGRLIEYKKKKRQ